MVTSTATGSPNRVPGRKRICRAALNRLLVEPEDLVERPDHGDVADGAVRQDDRLYENHPLHLGPHCLGGVARADVAQHAGYLDAVARPKDAPPRNRPPSPGPRPSPCPGPMPPPDPSPAPAAGAAAGRIEGAREEALEQPCTGLERGGHRHRRKLHVLRLQRLRLGLRRHLGRRLDLLRHLDRHVDVVLAGHLDLARHLQRLVPAAAAPAAGAGLRYPDDVVVDPLFEDLLDGSGADDEQNQRHRQKMTPERGAEGAADPPPLNAEKRNVAGGLPAGGGAGPRLPVRVGDRNRRPPPSPSAAAARAACRIADRERTEVVRGSSHRSREALPGEPPPDGFADMWRRRPADPVGSRRPSRGRPPPLAERPDRRERLTRGRPTRRSTRCPRRTRT